MATPEQNAATVRDLIERAMNENDLAFADKVLSDAYVEESPMPGSAGDKASAIAMFEMMRQQTPDYRIEIEDVIASGDKVAVRSTMHGTDTNGFMPGMPATNQPFAMGAIDIFTFDDDGMNIGHYGVYDIAGTMQQLGLSPGG
jgi:steroid delta-isomerase-like uncharacterized protein